MGKVKTKGKTKAPKAIILQQEVTEPEIIEPEIIEESEELQYTRQILAALIYINSILKKYPLVEVLLDEETGRTGMQDDYQLLYDNKESLVKEYFSYRIYNPTRKHVTFEQGIQEIIKKCNR